jgi:hypothetical protein
MSTNSMMPYDGVGYGKSEYWHNVALKKAIEYGEDCGCWGSTPFELSFGDDEFKVKIKCRVKTDTCKSFFEKTERKVEELFKQFYLV